MSRELRSRRSNLVPPTTIIIIISDEEQTDRLDPIRIFWSDLRPAAVVSNPIQGSVLIIIIIIISPHITTN